jgi:iron complex outermembrane receptor protein
LVFVFSGTILQAQDTINTPVYKKIDDELRVVTCYQAPPKIVKLRVNAYGLGSFLNKYTGQEPSFLFTSLPSITAYSDAGSTQGYSYMRIRGIDQKRINMSIDGVPLNEPEDQGAYFSNFPDLLSCMRYVELYRGASGVKNGTAGYGGNIGMSTREGNSKSAAIGAGYGSFNTYRIYGEYSSGTKNNKSFLVRAAHLHSNGYKYNSGNTSESVFMSGKIKDFKLNILIGHQQNQLAWLGVSDSLIAIDARTNGNKNENDNFTQGMAQLHYTKGKGPHFFRACAYYTMLQGNYDFNKNNFLGLSTSGEMYNYAFKSGLPGTYLRYEYNKGKISFDNGVFANSYHRQHIGSEKMMGTLYTNTGYKNEFSAFSKLDLRFKKLLLSGDLQYRYVNFSYSGNVKMQALNWQFLNPRGLIKFLLSDELSISYSLAHLGREPTRNDVFGGNDNLLSDSMGNPLLFITTPEYVTDHELGISFSKKQLSVNLTSYYMNFTNEIVLDGKFGPNGLALTNKVDKSFRTGIELSAKWTNNTIYFENNSSFNYSQIRQQSVEFTPILTPPLIINQDFGYKYKKFVFSTGFRYQGASFIDYANSATVNAYFLLHANIHYTTDHLTIGLIANNLTNVKYFNQGYVDWDGAKKYFVQAPMNFTIRFEYRFFKSDE